ncbi:queuine tRNA-ribosyltransferase catalytic subunit 1-like [Histomonas meleagridis]|uniref:queuine tRNA-ribosyltransferase catalytic subunit 1-like n=1 Tax=Histomonas meleagridis TaxID=135588 RepID=UPI003559526E|nr:queuine tRNA-ribosyltransferase catalytic subunit 1-like [Histomonas meleagridis]KAH0802332.1 queuine tRNA-ribosyltransferase catalytic subunit 1-like [Histomonas meleagridis]
MPVATQGSLKGLTPDQILSLPHSPPIILGNTYHLGTRPGPEMFEEVGGLHKWMNWPHGLLTDSGGFQMVSLSKLCQITEEGVQFSAPHASGCEILLKPEDSIHIQNAIGSNIAMMLDDVVPSTYVGPRVEEAMHRTIRWLDRAIAAHKRPHDQALFAIVQGGLDQDRRRYCATEMVKRKDSLGGFAIGGLSGGEAKEIFWQSVKTSVSCLPRDMPRYCMGVGYAEDIAVCIALGVDMFDCVFPTRTARFGTALIWSGSDRVSNWKGQEEPIERECGCYACTHLSRAALFHIRDTPMCGQLLSLHNVEFQNRLTSYFRQGIKEGKLDEYERNFFRARYPNGDYPQWIVDALSSEGIDLFQQD